MKILANRFSIGKFFPGILLIAFACFVLTGPVHAQLQDPAAPPLLPTAQNEDAPKPSDGELQPPVVSELDEDAGLNAPSLPGDPSLPDEGAPPALPVGPGASVSLDDEAAGSNFAQSQLDAQEAMRRAAFDAALQGLMPLRPQEIRELLEHFDRTQESVELPVYPPPRPEMVVQTMTLDPGSKPVSIKMAYGYVTTISFLDASGAPWPIKDVTWAGNFEIVQYMSTGDEYGYILRITPQSEFAYGNMSISMLTLKTPLIISLETSRDVVHYRFDAIIPENGPMASAPLIQGNSGIDMAAGDTDAAAVLEGAAPRSAVKMNVSGVDGRTSAYRMNGMTYLRTPLTLLSPAWISSVASADGMRVYTMNNSPVLLLSERGKVVRAHLTDREDIEGAVE